MENNEEIKKMLEYCACTLKCPRGKFYPNKDYGSQLNAVSEQENLNKLLAFARVAAIDIDGLYVKSVSKDNDNLIFDILINDEERQVSI